MVIAYFDRAIVRVVTDAVSDIPWILWQGSPLVLVVESTIFVSEDFPSPVHRLATRERLVPAVYRFGNGGRWCRQPD